MAPFPLSFFHSVSALNRDIPCLSCREKRTKTVSAVQAAAVHFVRTVFHFKKKQDRETEIHGRFKPVFQTREIFRSFHAKGRFWKSDGEILTALEGQERSGGPEGLRKVGEL